MIQVDPPDYPPWPTARRLTPIWWGQRSLVLLALFCALIYVALSLGIPILIQRAIDDAIVPGDPSDVWPYVIAIMVLAAIRFWINYTRRYATARIGVRIEAQLREMLFAGYLRFPRAFFDRHATGQVVSRATNDLYPIRYFIGWGVVQAVQSAMMIVGGAIVLALDQPAADAVHGSGDTADRVRRLALRPPGDADLAPGAGAQGRRHRGGGRGRRRHRDGAGVRPRGRRPHALRRQGAGGARHRHPPGRRRVAAPARRCSSCRRASIAAVVFFGGRDVINGDLTIGQFVLFNTILLQLAWPLEALGWILNLAQRAIASAGRSFAWLEEVVVPARAGRAGVAARRARSTCASRTSASPTSARRRCCVASTSTSRPARSSAVCGPTGSGKSTLLNLAPRYYDPTEGRLLIGGVDVRDLRLADLRDAVAVITQRPILFSITLYENVTAGRPDAPWDEVEAMCHAAGVSDFADDLPDGYQTLIGERGVNLSGGQRQRVALARALIAGTRVIVMDDPLSAVDTHTEHELVDRLRPVLEGRTVLLATQRLSTLELADRAVVLRDGRIAEDGAAGRPADRRGRLRRAVRRGDDRCLAARAQA